jgi:hypothetical protein
MTTAYFDGRDLPQFGAACQQADEAASKDELFTVEKLTLNSLVCTF